MLHHKFWSFAMLFIGLCFSNCNSDVKEDQSEIDSTELKETLVKANKLFVERENERINSYIARYNYNMVETGTGLRYELLNTVEGEPAKDGDYVKLVYTCKVVDGEQLVGIDGVDTLEFIIGKTELPAGLNEGVQLMGEGSKARFILPTHLAYGLTGDEENVPANAALLYNVQLLKIEKAKNK
jgi:FKBP-type peptidyl-prolyl cis-trans isomerase